MKKIVITTLALFFLSLNVQAEEQVAAQGAEGFQLTEKEKLMVELRTLRRLKEDDRPKSTATSVTANIPTVAVDHPEFGIEDLYPEQPAPKLDSQTQQALKKTKKWLNQTNTPIVRNGNIVHPFGSGIPTLVLEPMAISNIELSADETIVHKGVQLADQERWSVIETYAGSNRNKFPNLIVKSRSLDENKTVLIISTTKRIYHIQLVATNGEWTPRLSFSYPDEAVERSPETISRLLAENAQGNDSGASTVEPQDAYLYAAGDIDFGYSIKGDQMLMPSRVFSLGHQTVIEMPDSIAGINAPALLLEDSEGNEEMVNVIFNDKTHRYIVNQPVHKAYLISGVGWDQSKVTIEKLEGM
jgi:type IV secretion system protein VirB9